MNKDFKETYSDKNLYETVKSIRRDLLNKFDVDSEEYQEELASKFYLLCKRMRDNYLDTFLQALPEDVDTKGTQVGDGYNTALRDVRNILNEARNK